MNEMRIPRERTKVLPGTVAMAEPFGHLEAF